MVSSAPDRAAPVPAAPDHAELFAECDRLIGAGRALDAIAKLTAADRRRPSAAIEQRLVALRHEAFAGMTPSTTRASWPPQGDDLFPGALVPEIHARDLTAEAIRSGIVQHGCLLVRDFAGPARVRQLVDDIDRAFDAFDAHEGGAPVAETTPWYVPFKAMPGYFIGQGRKWVRDGGGVWTVESPRAMFDTLETFTESGFASALTEYLGERPALSVKKWTLRRVPLSSGTDWHQDGAFLGEHLRTVNVWLALTHCGDTAPGLDVVPRRLDQLAERNTEGAWFDWSVGDPVARRLADGNVVRPIFEAGDALLFDQLFLHRTAVDEAMTQERYAIESWFFAPSCYPDDQVPIVF